MVPSPRTPDDLIDIANGYFAPRAVSAAVRTGVFAVLAGGPKAAADVAREARLDPRATDLLLRALAGMGLVEWTGERFALAPIAGECLAPGSPRDVTHFFGLTADTFEAWARMEDALRTGEPIRVSSRAAREGDAGRHRDFILAMESTARRNAPLVAARLDLAAILGREPETLLDLGAGPATYAVEFCRRWPRLRATAFDLEETVAIVRPHVLARAPAEAPRIAFCAGDFHKDPLGGPFDVAWVSHVVHGHPEPTLPPLFERIGAALAPGGALAIHDFILDDSRTRPAFGALFALNMLVASDHGRTYAFSELSAMLARAGFEGAEWLDFGEPRGISIVVARKL
jgi:SAM-dependent methyltransferase